MTHFRAASFVLAVLVFAAGCSEAQSTQGSISSGKVDAVIERTKSTRATYSIYNWNILSPAGGAIVEEWSAEFNMANQHRVETPRDRVVADCEAQIGSWLSLQTATTETGPGQAMAACGINTNKEFLSKEWVGYVTTPFGTAERVRVSDQDLIRTYDVDSDGAILRSVFETNDDRHVRVILDLAVSYKHNVPDKKMFDKQSLQKSYVPEAFTLPPAVPIR